MPGRILLHAYVGVLYYSPQAGGHVLDNSDSRGARGQDGGGGLLGVEGGVKGWKTTGVAWNVNVHMSICVAQRPTAAGIEKHLLLM